MFNTILKFIKYSIIKNSRKKILVEEISKLINFELELTIVDYGSGYDCYVARNLKQLLEKKGIVSKFICYDNFKDIKKNNEQLPVEENGIKFENTKPNFEVDECDYLMINDVLHHIENLNNEKLELIFKKFFKKANRIILKDHFQYGFFSNKILQFMDYIGNSYYGLKTPKKYFNKKYIDEFLFNNGYEVEKKILDVKYYSSWFLFLSNPKLHFIYLIKKAHK